MSLSKPIPRNASNPLPIFQLPDLVRELVFGGMSMVDKLSMTFCSKRSKNVVKSMIHRKKEAYQLSVQLGDKWDDQIEGTISNAILLESPAGPREILTVNSSRLMSAFRKQRSSSGSAEGQKFLVLRGAQMTETYWEDVSFGLKIMISHFRDLFKTNIGHVENLDSSFSARKFFAILDGVIEQQGRIESVKTILNLVDNVPKPRLNCFNSVDTLTVTKCYWHTLPVLMALSCKNLVVTDSCIDNEQLNTYFLAWINGQTPDVEHLKIHRDQTLIWILTREGAANNEHQIFEGIDGQENPNRVLENDTTQYRNRHLEIIPTDIRRNDGAIGTVFGGHFIVDFVVWK